MYLYPFNISHYDYCVTSSNSGFTIKKNSIFTIRSVKSNVNELSLTNLTPAVLLTSHPEINSSRQVKFTFNPSRSKKTDVDGFKKFFVLCI